MPPTREEIAELLTEPTEVTRWGILVASITVALIGGALELAVG